MKNRKQSVFKILKNFNVDLFILRERVQAGEGQRERERERIPRFSDSTEPYVGLSFMNHKIMT